MRDDELRRLLTEANPWWRAVVAGSDTTAWASSHRVFRARTSYDLGHRATVLDDVKSEPIDGRLIVLAGPRRVGKSVALLEVALALCGRKDVDARQVIHIPCDELKARDLRRVLTLAVELTRSIDTESRVPRVWLFDEITQVTGWTAAIKVARDGTAFGEDTVVLTGSRWVKGADIAANLMAGRAGEISDHRRLRILLPMSFREYLAVSRRNLPLLEPVGPVELQSITAKNQLEQVRFDVDAYDNAWQEYLTCGGFPRAVYEQIQNGGVSRPYARDLLAWLEADVEPDGTSESVSALLIALEKRSSSPLNATNTSEHLGYENRSTFERRLLRMTAAFAGLRCPHRDEQTGNPVMGSQSKYYLIDPILAWLPKHLRAGAEPPDMTRLTEMTLGVTLARAIEASEERRWLDEDTIGFTRTDSGNEVDLSPVPILTTSGNASSVPIESKWVDSNWRSEALVMTNKYHRGVLATKSILDLNDDVWAVPAPLVALLLV